MAANSQQSPENTAWGALLRGVWVPGAGGVKGLSRPCELEASAACGRAVPQTARL